MFVHVLGSYQLYTNPVFDMLEKAMLKNGLEVNLLTRLIYRSAYVTLVTFIAVRVHALAVSKLPTALLSGTVQRSSCCADFATSRVDER